MCPIQGAAAAGENGWGKKRSTGCLTGREACLLRIYWRPRFGGGHACGNITAVILPRSCRRLRRSWRVKYVQEQRTCSTLLPLPSPLWHPELDGVRTVPSMCLCLHPLTSLWLAGPWSSPDPAELPVDPSWSPGPLLAHVPSCGLLRSAGGPAVAAPLCSRETVNQTPCQKRDSDFSLGFWPPRWSIRYYGERDAAPAHLLWELRAERRRGSRESPTAGKHVGEHGAGGGRR